MLKQLSAYDLKDAGNIGCEDSARHNAFMFSVIDVLQAFSREISDRLLERLKTARNGYALTVCLPCFMSA